MMQLKCATFVCLAFTLLLFADNAQATHTTFDYQVESFQVTGNLPNGLIDEFDDGILTVTAPLGTVSESGGALHLESEGSHHQFPGVSSLLVDRSDAIMDPGFAVVNSFGDFTATAVLRNLTFQPGGYFASNFAYNDTGTTVELLSLSVFSGSPEIAADINAMYPVLDYSGTGLNLSATRVIFNLLDPGLPITVIDHETINVSSASLTDDILFRMAFTDTSDDIVGSISLDGGSTYSTFSSISPTGLGATDVGIFTLFGDPITVVPEPSTALLMSLGLLGLSIAGKQRDV